LGDITLIIGEKMLQLTVVTHEHFTASHSEDKFSRTISWSSFGIRT